MTGSAGTGSQGLQVDRILYKEIVPGDIRKIHAASNDADTGGGARDFRFGSFSMISEVIEKMFPNKVTELRTRNSERTAIEIYEGEFHWLDANGKAVKKVSYFEPPTSARPAEGRITRVHEYECFATSKLPNGGEGNRVLLLLLQRSDSSVWPYYVEQSSLETKGKWNPVVANEILDCINAERSAGRAVIGYRDFTNQKRYCNGK